MKNIIKAIVLFLLPILKGAFIKAAADELTKLAYPERRPIRRQPNYSAFGGSGSMADFSRLERERITQPRKPLGRYHDVLMLAIDITGPNQALVEEFIMTKGVRPGLFMHNGEQFDIDSTWVADDLADGDCDSVVFVHKGKQEEARKLLREHGLVG